MVPIQFWPKLLRSRLTTVNIFLHFFLFFQIFQKHFPLPQSHFFSPTPIFISNLKSLFENDSQNLSPQHSISEKKLPNQHTFYQQLLLFFFSHVLYLFLKIKASIVLYSMDFFIPIWTELLSNFSR